MAPKAIPSHSAPETADAANARAEAIIKEHQAERKHQTITDKNGNKTEAEGQVQHKHLPSQEELDRWIERLNGKGSWETPTEKHWVKENLRLDEDNTTVLWKDGSIIRPRHLWGAKMRDAHIKTDANGASVHIGRDATQERLKEADENKKPKWKIPQKEIIMAFIRGCPQCKESKKRKRTSSGNNAAAGAAVPAPATSRRIQCARRGPSALAGPSSSPSTPLHQQHQLDTTLASFLPQAVAQPAAQYYDGPDMANFVDDPARWYQPQQEQWESLFLANCDNDWAYNTQSSQEQGFTASPVGAGPAAQPEQQIFPDGTVNLGALAVEGPFIWDLTDDEFYAALAASSDVLAPDNAEQSQ